MLAIGRALMAQPKLLLLDEPLLGLSPLIQSIMVRSTKEIRDEKGISIIVTEQYARPVLPIVDYGFILENGAAVLEGTRKELLENSYIEPTYFSSSKRKRVLSGITTEWIHFHCLVVKEGYEPYLIEDWFKDETGVHDVPNAFRGKKTYTARLVPIQRSGDLADF